jgi:hypothetical protein
MTNEKLNALVMHLMSILDSNSNIGITARATPEAIELLKGSDSPFAGYVISCLVENDEASLHYDDWVKRTITRSFKED